MSIAFLATGDELVHGDTLNTNSQVLANALCSEGMSIGHHLTCSDKESDMIEALNFLRQSHDAIIIIGGLGPTRDDRTRFALAQHTALPLITHPAAMQHIKARFAEVNVQYTESNAQQALFPKDTVLLPNPRGTAMGGYFYHNNVLYALVPGPPRECLPMFEQHLLPVLLKKQHSQKSMIKWRVFGLAESKIADMVESLLKDTGYQSGYRLDPPYLDIKVRFPKGEERQVKEKLEHTLQPYIISPSDRSASSQLKDYISQMTESVHIVDNCTGGILQSILQTPDNHHRLHFNSTDNAQYTFRLQGLKEYWQGAPSPSGESKVSIEFHSEALVGNESHVIPCRKTMPRHFAAEWLSFRIFHLLHQLH